MRETHKKVQQSVDVREGNAYKLPIEDSSVDAIVCAQVNCFPRLEDVGS